MKIGILSDTHGYLDERIFTHFSEVDEIWHIGDIGDEKVLDQLEAFKPTRAVFGNIDSHVIRRRIKETELFYADKAKILMIHIGGYPGRYAPGVRALIKEHQPHIFLSGHSHILKVMPDKLNNLLHINPGAAGKSGFHKVCTLVKLEIQGDRPVNLEVIEFDR